MRLGVLDVGSNTVHLLVVDAHQGAHPWPAYSEKAELRLAERIGADGKLSRAGGDALVAAATTGGAAAAARRGGAEAARLGEAARRAGAAAASHETEDFLAFATSAVRDATN